jgi:hypothetical protein
MAVRPKARSGGSKRPAPPRSRPRPKPSGKSKHAAPPPKKKAPTKPVARPSAPVAKKGKPTASKPVKPPKGPAPEEVPAALPRSGDARRHLLSLSFLRDGDEFMARLETDGGQITELKNRSLDQLLTLVANELEDLLE